MKKIVFIMILLVPTISNAAFNAAKEQYGVLAALESVAAGLMFKTKKRLNPPLLREKAVRLMLLSHFPDVIASDIMQYKGNLWVMRSEKEVHKGGLYIKGKKVYSSDGKYRVFKDGLGTLMLESLQEPFTTHRLQTAVPRAPLEGVHRGWCPHVDFPPNNQKVAVLGEREPIIEVCNLDGQLVQTIHVPDECKGYSFLEAVSNHGDYVLASMEEKKEILVGQSRKRSDNDYELTIIQRLPAHDDPVLALRYFGNNKLKSADRAGMTREYERICD